MTRHLKTILTIPILCLSACATVPAPQSGIAYAWAVFDSGGVVDSGAGGLADPKRGRQLTIDDPVRIASISKLFVAIGVMRLVEEGRLDRDRDVSEWLGWRLRHPDFPGQAITLRMLLSHRSSLTDQVNYAIPLGGSVQATTGEEGAFDPDHRPGSFFRYSNLNFPVVASVMEGATSERFDRLMARLVIDPLGIDACFNWTRCSDEAVARAVILHAPDGSVIRDDLKGQRPDCSVLALEGSGCDLEAYVPGTNGALFSPQGGLRISARDLAVIGQLFLNGGWHQGRRFLSRQSVEQMISPQWRYYGPESGETEAGTLCAYGLAVQILPNDQPGCSDDLFGDGRQVFGHSGDAYGLRSGIWIDPVEGRGIAYFATGNGDDPPLGRSAFRAVEEELARRIAR